MSSFRVRGSLLSHAIDTFFLSFSLFAGCGEMGGGFRGVDVSVDGVSVFALVCIIDSRGK